MLFRVTNTDNHAISHYYNTCNHVVSYYFIKKELNMTERMSENVYLFIR